MTKLAIRSTPSPLFKFAKTKGRVARILSASAPITSKFAPTRGAKSILFIMRRSERVMPGPPLRGTKNTLEERALIGLSVASLGHIAARKRSARRLRALDTYPKRIDARALGIAYPARSSAETIGL